MVNHTTDGHTFQKEETDTLIIIALGAAGTECLFCVISSFVSCRMAHEAKKELFKKREGTFHVQVVGEKDIVVVTRPLTDPIEEDRVSTVWQSRDSHVSIMWYRKRCNLSSRVF